jgi:hypothetical protein
LSVSWARVRTSASQIPSGTTYGDRIHQFDVRIAKTVKYGRSRTLIALNVYNALNASAVLTCDNSFVPGGSRR